MRTKTRSRLSRSESLVGLTVIALLLAVPVLVLDGPAEPAAVVYPDPPAAEVLSVSETRRSRVPDQPEVPAVQQQLAGICDGGSGSPAAARYLPIAARAPSWSANTPMAKRGLSGWRGGHCVWCSR